MRQEELESLSALVDGERVEPERLAHALAAPGAPALLVDFVRLREQLRDEARPPQAFSEAMSRRLGRRTRVRSWLAAGGAAALLAAALWLARPAPRPSDQNPPQPDRVIRLEPGRDWSAGPAAEGWTVEVTR